MTLRGLDEYLSRHDPAYDDTRDACGRCLGSGVVHVVVSHWHDDTYGFDCETEEAPCPDCLGER